MAPYQKLVMAYGTICVSTSGRSMVDAAGDCFGVGAPIMSRLAKGFGELELLPFGELLEIHERIENLINERSESAISEIGKDRRLRPAERVPSGLTKKIRLVAAKYRDPYSGVTWSGRGKEPRWMSHLIRQGARREDFLVGKKH